MAAVMKKVRAMLAPVKTRNTDASDSPITAEKAKKAVRAEAAVIRSMRNEKKKMKASGASITTHLSGVWKIGT
jgi:hypothetical protein